MATEIEKARSRKASSTRWNGPDSPETIAADQDLRAAKVAYAIRHAGVLPEAHVAGLMQLLSGITDRQADVA